MRSIGGLPFDFGAAHFSNEELRLLDLLDRLDVEPFVKESFVLERTVDSPWAPTERPGLGEPAVMSFGSNSVRIAHAEGIGEIDLVARRGVYARFSDSAAPLRAMLRTAVVSMLPLHGGIPLHAAGLGIGEEAVVLFGESGAGKSTVAAMSQLPVLSDEIVAITINDGRAVARTTGFGDEVYAAAPVGVAKPVAALVELAKADRFAVTPLAHAEALRSLLKVILSPPHPLVWNRAIEVLGALLATKTPIVRMAWTGDLSPIADLLSALGR